MLTAQVVQNRRVHSFLQCGKMGLSFAKNLSDESHNSLRFLDLRPGQLRDCKILHSGLSC
jgi:hypothetical protein